MSESVLLVRLVPPPEADRCGEGGLSAGRKAFPHKSTDKITVRVLALR
jgi:hypothetical protein